MKKKKLQFAVLAGIALGAASCASAPPKLDLSTVDFSQPMSVGMIIWTFQESASDFFAKNAVNGEIRDDLLLSKLCGTAANNLKSIEEQFKAETGITITLNGDEFLQELKDGNTRGIVTQTTKALGMKFRRVQWRITNHENPDAIIQLVEHNERRDIEGSLIQEGRLIPNYLGIDYHDAMGNTERQAAVYLLRKRK